MIQNQSLFDIAVAPPAGAWIETEAGQSNGVLSR